MSCFNFGESIPFLDFSMQNIDKDVFDALVILLRNASINYHREINLFSVIQTTPMAKWCAHFRLKGSLPRVWCAFARCWCDRLLFSDEKNQRTKVHIAETSFSDCFVQLMTSFWCSSFSHRCQSQLRDKLLFTTYFHYICVCCICICFHSSPCIVIVCHCT